MIMEACMILVAAILGYGFCEVKHKFDYMEGFKSGRHEGYMEALDDFDDDLKRGE